MGQNLVYIAAICQILSLPISLAIWLGWKPSQMIGGKAALGIALIVVQASSWAALYSVYSHQNNRQVVRIEAQKEPSVAVATGAVETALREQNAELRTENARLRKVKTSHFLTLPPAPSAIPSACPPVTQVLFPSRINAEDCDALTGAQRLVDSADGQRMDLVRGLNSGTLKDTAHAEQQIASLIETENQAIANLQGLQTRLCITVIPATPVPAK